MWSEQQRLTASSQKALATFGISVAINMGRILVGAPALDLRGRQTPPGEAYLFKFDPGTRQWNSSLPLRAAVPRPIDLFGASIGLTSTALVIGSNGDASTARGIDGDASRSDGSLVGAAYMFALQGSDYVPSAFIKAFNSETDDNFGHTLVTTESYVAVAAPFESGAGRSPSSQDAVDVSNNSARSSGAVYVYR
jgi:hypothetical protein